MIQVPERVKDYYSDKKIISIERDPLTNDQIINYVVMSDGQAVTKTDIWEVKPDGSWVLVDKDI